MQAAWLSPPRARLIVVGTKRLPVYSVDGAMFMPAQDAMQVCADPVSTEIPARADALPPGWRLIAAGEPRG